MSMTITDVAGLQADTLQIDIDDADASVIAPRTGAVLRPVGGYADVELRDFGTFVVDTVTYEGWPQRISISAKSVDALSLAKQRNRKGFPPDKFPTYGDVFDDIAKGVGLTLRMAPELKSEANHYEAQSDESSIEFLERIAEKLGAAVTVKAGHLIVVMEGAGQSASGSALDQIPVRPGVNLIGYSVSLRDEAKHEEVDASWYDRDANEVKTESESTGLDGPRFSLRYPFQNRDDAKRAAKAQAKDLRRLQGTASFEIDGSPFAQAEAYAAVSGVRPGVDGLWRVATVTHNFSASGPYTTSLSCETPSGEE
ncbi:phage late control D family protein [Ancylobacter terrae]|uniref:phage late control D family protein n=1 Tax=Ancylobacter sp. sgz301288 TaxID=3342077 RepID=UPI00386BD113